MLAVTDIRFYPVWPRPKHHCELYCGREIRHCARYAELSLQDPDIKHPAEHLSICIYCAQRPVDQLIERIFRVARELPPEHRTVLHRYLIETYD